MEVEHGLYGLRGFSPLVSQTNREPPWTTPWVNISSRAGQGDGFVRVKGLARSIHIRFYMPGHFVTCFLFLCEPRGCIPRPEDRRSQSESTSTDLLSKPILPIPQTANERKRFCERSFQAAAHPSPPTSENLSTAPKSDLVHPSRASLQQPMRTSSCPKKLPRTPPRGIVWDLQQSAGSGEKGTWTDAQADCECLGRSCSDQPI